MIDEFKHLLKENLITIILFVAYSLVLTNESKLGIDNIVGGESIAHVTTVVLFISLLLFCSYIKRQIYRCYQRIRSVFNICLNVVFESEDDGEGVSTEDCLKIKLNRYSADSKTYDFHIKIQPSQNLKFIKRMFSFLGNESKLSNLYLQLYWKPKASLQIIPHKNYPFMTHFQGYPSIYFNCIVPSNIDIYSMKISSTTDQPQSNKIGFNVRKHCDKKAGILS